MNSYFEEGARPVSIVGAVEITSTNSSRFVTLNTDGEFVLAAADAAPFGVITTNQIAGAAGRVVIAGTVPVEAGEDIVIGDLIASGADGVAVVAADEASSKGIARTAGGEGDVVAVQLARPI